jgi:hypothetical protein
MSLEQRCMSEETMLKLREAVHKLKATMHGLRESTETSITDNKLLFTDALKIMNVSQL